MKASLLRLSKAFSRPGLSNLTVATEDMELLKAVDVTELSEQAAAILRGPPHTPPHTGPAHFCPSAPLYICSFSTIFPWDQVSQLFKK